MKQSTLKNIALAITLVAMGMTQVACSAKSSTKAIADELGDLVPPPPTSENPTEPTDPVEEEETDFKIGEETFSLYSALSASYTPDGDFDAAYKDFVLENASSSRDMYVSSEALQMSDQCEAAGGKLEYKWIEVDNNGEVISSTDVTDWVDFSSQLGRNYIFRISFKNIRDCGYVSVSTAVSGF